MIKVCSGWHPAGSVQYGRTFLETFDRNWPGDVRLEVYVEKPEPMPRDACRLLWDIPGAKEFAEAYRGDKAAQGREPRPCWKPSEVRKGYSYRTDAYKFFKQILIPGAAAQDMEDDDILIWLDGDVETIRKMPPRFIPALMANVDVCYLGRQPQHSEIGFYGIRINDRTKAFLTEMARIYTTGKFTEYPEWHSAYIFDRAKEKFTLRERNLCKPGARGHVFPLTTLAPYLVHRKGPRKGA